MDNQKKIEKMYQDKVKRIDKAIDRREKSIAYFNSVNAAIQLCVNFVGRIDSQKKAEVLQIAIKEWRDWFYHQWQEWFLENMPNEWEEEMKKLPPEYQKAQKAEDERDIHKEKERILQEEEIADEPLRTEE